MNKSRTISAICVAAAISVSTGIFNVLAADQPKAALGLSLVRDGGKLFVSNDGEIEKGKTMTFKAETDGFMKSGSNGFQAATFELQFDKDSKYTTSVADIKSFAFEITELKFDGKDVLESAHASYSLVDSNDGCFNLKDAIDGKAWVGEDEAAITIKTVEMTVNITEYEPKNKPEQPIEESSSKQDTNSKSSGNPKTGISFDGVVLLAAMTAVGAVVVSKRK